MATLYELDEKLFRENFFFSNANSKSGKNYTFLFNLKKI